MRLPCRTGHATALAGGGDKCCQLDGSRCFCLGMLLMTASEACCSIACGISLHAGVGLGRDAGRPTQICVSLCISQGHIYDGPA